MSENQAATLDVRNTFIDDYVAYRDVPSFEAKRLFDEWLINVQEDARVAGYLEGYDAGMDEAIEMARQ